MATQRGALTQAQALSGHMIQNNGEDLEYLESLAGVTDDKWDAFWEAAKKLKADMDAERGALTAAEKTQKFR